ncbi:MAG: COX15/CtaA family protein [Synechococcus sp. ELA619]
MASRLQRQLQLLTAHLVVALVALVVIGGATRVMQAGLACPDWPLCYGSFLPGRQMNLQVFLEWFHRLDAFVVGMGVLVLATTTVVQRRQLPRWLPWLSGACLVLVAFQGGLGALTVTLLLPPAIVTAHLATALLLVILVSVCHQLLEAGAAPLGPEPLARSLGASGLSMRGLVPGPGALPLPTAPPWWPWLAGLATLLVAAQSLLGGLMATQWAASLCFSAGSGCGWLGAHRFAATPAALGVLLLAVLTALSAGWCRQQRPLTTTAALLVISQIALGVSSLRLQLAVPGVTIAHQLVAALLLAILAALTCRGWLGLVAQPISASAADPRSVLSPSSAEVVHG